MLFDAGRCVRLVLGAILLQCVLCTPLFAADRWSDLYDTQVYDGMPCRVMKPYGFNAEKKYPLIVSLHGAGGKGTDNKKQLKDWNRQLAHPQRRKDFPCYVVAPQAAELWDENDLRRTKGLIKTLQAVDTDRIYILGHSMGGHGTYIFIQLDPDYFAAAAPSAGSGLRRTEDFIDPKKIRDIPIWAFHGDKDGVCPIARDQKVFDEMKRLGGNMKFTIWKGDNHGVSGKFIVGADNGTTLLSSNRCDKESEFMKWLFARSRNAKER
jgi:predicted peptidase